MVRFSQLRRVLTCAMDADAHLFQAIRADLFKQALPGISDLKLRNQLRRYSPRVLSEELSDILEPCSLAKPQRFVSRHLATELNRWG